MKPFRLSKNHNDTGIFRRNNEVIQNDGNNQIFEENVIHMDNNNNLKNIRIEPMLINHEIQKEENDFRNFDSINNMEL